jgi:predicted acetyltransferase
MDATSLIIKPIDHQTRGQYLDLCQFCFGMPDSSRDRYVTEDHELAHSLGAFDGDRLAAGMWYFTFDMRVRDRLIPMAGVAAVATWPEYRNRGLVRRLLSESQQRMRTEKRPLSVLMPFKYRFYYDLGWATTFEVSVLTFEPQKIKALPDEGYRVRQVTDADEWETFEALQNRFGEPYNGPVCRDRHYWMRRYFAWDAPHRRNAYLVEKDGEPRGFVISRLEKKTVDDKDKLDMFVIQAVWLDPGAQRAVFSFLRAHRDQVRQVRLLLPPDVRWVHLFDNPEIEYRIRPKMMTKLVDFKSALESLSYDPACAGAVHLEIAGETTAPWNDGTWKVTFGAGHAQVEQASPPGGAARLSIQSAAELYMGYRSVSELVDARELAGPDAALELLDRAFPRHVTYIDDWF